MADKLLDNLLITTIQINDVTEKQNIRHDSYYLNDEIFKVRIRCNMSNVKAQKQEYNVGQLHFTMISCRKYKKLFSPS